MELIMTSDDEKIIKAIVTDAINNSISKLPCSYHGENLTRLITKFDNHIDVEKERMNIKVSDKRISIDLWKVGISLITLTILILQFLRR